MFWNKTKYEPKVGDVVLRWGNIMTGLEPTRIQKKPRTAILIDTRKILLMTEYAYKFEGEKGFTDKDFYFLEKLA